MLSMLAALAAPLEGVDYLLETQVVTVARIPFAGRREVVTRSLAAVRFHKSGEGWLQEQIPCEVAVDGGQVTFPPAFVDHLPSRTAPVQWTDGSYRFDPGPTELGVLPGTDPLPTDKRSPVVVDHDGDGHPGATVHLAVPVFGRVELYLVQATHSVLHGHATEEGFAGRIEVLRLDQSTLGASVGVFAVSPPIERVEGASTWSIRPDTQHRCSGRFPSATAVLPRHPGAGGPEE